MGKLKQKGFFKQAYLEEVSAQIVRDLTDLGKDAAKHAIENRGYKNRLYNLHDSIGSAVYFNGKLIPSSIRFADRKKSEGEAREGYTGREAINEWFQANRVIGVKNTFHLVLVAAMPYAEYLEKGTSGKKEQIQVISAGTDYIQQHLQEYKYFSPKIVQVTGEMVR